MHMMGSILAFSAYFFIGVAMVMVFLFIYTKVTPHDEWQLIKDDNTAAAVALSGTLLGFVIPLSSAAVNSVGFLDYVVWGGVAFVVQLLIYAGVRLYMPTLGEKIANNSIGAGTFMGVFSLAGGMLNAACMTW